MSEVHTGSYFLASVEASTSPSSSTGLEQRSLWKNIWKIRTPNKICYFIWQVVHDSLPTKQNFRARHIPIDETCELYNDHQKSLLHCLWLCDQA